MSTPPFAFELNPKARTFATPWEEPAVVQAASVAMALLRKTKTDSLADLIEAIRVHDAIVLKALESVNLTVRQRSLLAEFARPLSILRCNPHAHLLYCADCGAHTAIGSSAPTKCQITYGCLSKDQHKSTFAKYLPAGEPVPEAESHSYQPEPSGQEDWDGSDDWGEATGQDEASGGDSPAETGTGEVDAAGVDDLDDYATWDGPYPDITEEWTDAW